MSRVVNPYNFVPFSAKAPERISPQEEIRDEASLLHGWLDVNLENTTPLIIPEGTPWSVDAKEHKSYHFFRLPDEKHTPAIPGSELRGLARSVYETVTNSCTAVVLDHNDYSMRTPTNGSFKCKGLLEYDPQAKAWRLYEAAVHAIILDRMSYSRDLQKCGARYLGKYQNGQKVWFSGSGTHVRLTDEKQGSRQGWIFFNLPAIFKDHYRISILEKKESSLLKVWYRDKDGKPDNTPFRMLDEIMDPQKIPKGKSRTNVQSDYWEALKNVRDHGGCLPVWYLRVERGNEAIYYLSNASIGRVHINRSWKEILGTHAPCEKYSELCPACRLFGTVADGGWKGRLRFSDALYADGDPKPEDFGTRTLGILSGPRPSAYEFYIRRPSAAARYWNYDYYGKNGEDGLKYFDMATPSPRGRKFYWHGSVSEKDETRSNQNSTMEFLKENHHFKFQIWFDGITRPQLSALEYALTMGENRPDSRMQLKIGHARPLGYGSVKLTISACTIRQLKRDEKGIASVLRSEPVPADIPAPMNADPVPLAALKAMCNKKSTENEVVAYPQYDRGKGNGPTIFDWFANNRTGRGGWKVLPEPVSPDITLEASNGRASAAGARPADRFGSNYPGGNRPFGTNSSQGRASGSFGRPSGGFGSSGGANANHVETAYSSLKPAAPDKDGPLSPGTIRDRARIARVEGKEYVWVTFSKSAYAIRFSSGSDSSSNNGESLNGRLRYREADKKRYTVGKDVRIRIKAFNQEKNYYEVEIC